jgi:hypothetical protein
VEFAQNPLVKKDCAVIPIIKLAEGEKQRKSAQGNVETIIPIKGITGLNLCTSPFLLSRHFSTSGTNIMGSRAQHSFTRGF